MLIYLKRQLNIVKKTGNDLLLVSSVGADSKSSNFYLALKGEVEDYLVKRNIPSITIFRPSLLLGNRKEFRVGEIISTLFMKPLAFWFLQYTSLLRRRKWQNLCIRQLYPIDQVFIFTILQK